MLLPALCVACDQPAALLCADCRTSLAPAPDLGVPEGLDRLWALLAYEGAGRELVASIKYHHRRSAVARLAPAMAALVDEPFDLVTWLPTTAARRRARGYDQARLFARAVAPCLAPRRTTALLRRRSGPPQTGRPAVERFAGPALEPRRLVPGQRVLVIDDVVTTGASMRAASIALRVAGAEAVSGLALARTPLKTARRKAETSR